MGYTARNGERVMLPPEAARLYEHDSRGPGAHRSPSRRQLDRRMLALYSREQVLGGWVPQI